MDEENKPDIVSVGTDPRSTPYDEDDSTAGPNTLIKNYTANAVNVYSGPDADSPVITQFESCLEDGYDENLSDEPEYKIDGVPVHQKSIVTPELPDPQPDIYLLVSLPTALKRDDRDDLLVMGELVRNDEGTVVGCTSFAMVGDRP